MKFEVGDLVEFKGYILRLSRRPQPHPRLNSLGIILSCEDHKSRFKSDSTEDDNGYVWFSQEESTEFYFYENELVKT
jgi:hypothetical protein